MRFALLCIFCLLFVGPISFALEECPQKLAPAKPITSINDVKDCLGKDNKLYCAKGNSTSSSQTIGPVTYGIFTAQSSMEGLFKQVAQLQDQFMRESTPCPDGCKAHSRPSIEMQSSPSASEPNASCPSTYTRIKLSEEEISPFKAGGIFQGNLGFKKILKLPGTPDEVCQKQSSEWAKSTLTGDNELGKVLERTKCQDPCSFSSTIRITRLEFTGGCAAEVEVAVLCGPPKKSREWTSQAKLIKAVVCEEVK